MRYLGEDSVGLERLDYIRFSEILCAAPGRGCFRCSVIQGRHVKRLPLATFCRAFGTG